MTFEEFEKALYKKAEKDTRPEYAKESLDFANEIREIKRLYEEGKTLDSAYYLLTF